MLIFQEEEKGHKEGKEEQEAGCHASTKVGIVSQSPAAMIKVCVHAWLDAINLEAKKTGLV